MKLPFVKMQGLGNCFVLMDDRDDKAGSVLAGRFAEPLSHLAIGVCDRNFGIGADGLILVRNSDIADYQMRIINEDGSEAEMCGNGIRCMAKFLVDEGILGSNVRATPASPLRIDTLAGIIQTRLLDDGLVEVDMGEPILNNEDVILDGEAPLGIREEGYDFTYVSMGNPHAVAFVDSLDFDWRAVGAKIELSKSFPNRTNVEFVKVVSPKQAVMKVWERGCGETLACGTGACAVGVAGALRDKLSRDAVTIELPGGPLQISWNKENRVMMTGPAETVCRGTYFVS